MTVRERDIVQLAAECFRVPPAQVNRADLLATVDDDGKASSRFLKLYALRFRVGTSGFRWYFHHRDHGAFAMPLVARDAEGNAIRVPLSAAMLARFAEHGRWEVEYPQHRLGLTNRWWAVVVFGICGLGMAYAFLVAA